MENISYQDIQQAFRKTQEEFRFPDGRLELITDECSQKMLNALKQCILTDEPLAKSLELTWSPDVEDYYVSTLKQRMSLMVVNEKNGDIMGLRLIRTGIKSDHFDNLTDEKVKKILGFIQFSSKDFEYFAKPGTSEAFGFNGLGVLPKYRRQGLGTLLTETGVKFLGNLLKPCYIKGSATSNFSKRIFEKCGFETLAEFPYEDYKVDEKVVLDKMGENKSMKVYGKCIQ
ncbi:uncharacterized protein LOC123563092 [Mercenaria mercenaria]|uniref:uncharacterized protein LOC123563092 n=1 Tax=Mercenaria mercenaria TaxID=6596 RepID=UPI00234E3BC1|nr:uncharacterized protein LOC123563092 [Mercenaria mercenaria]